MSEIKSQASSPPTSTAARVRIKRHRRPPIFGSNRGFTLLEILIVIGIMGVLMGIATRFYVGALERARVARAASEIRVIEKLIAPRLLDDGGLPGTLDDLDWKSLDPWGRPYVYVNFDLVDPDDVPGDARRDKFQKPLNSRFDLYSTGRDGSTDPQVTATASWDDVLRAGDGVFVGLASEY